MVLQGATHKIRVFRASRSRKHDLHSVLATEDIYGADKPAIVMESEAEYIADLAGVGGLSVHPARIIVADDVDLDEGYFIEVKKPMVLDGSWQAVETTATSALTTGDTTIAVSSSIGFGAGDQVLVKDENGEELTKVKSVATGTITLYSDVALENNYLSGATVRAARYFQVMAVKWPHQTAGHREADMQEMLKVASS